MVKLLIEGAMSRFQLVGRGNEWEECMPIVLGPDGEQAHNIPAHGENLVTRPRPYLTV